ncbi:MAG: hypothetical protein ACKN81_06545 [Pirellulaceae bacterium]
MAYGFPRLGGGGKEVGWVDSHLLISGYPVGLAMATGCPAAWQFSQRCQRWER